jgi:hypothetical protein
VAGNAIGSLATTPVGTERGLLVRQVGVADVHSPDSTVTGTITATDAVVAAPGGDGVLRSGTSTAGSIVALACPGGDSSWTAQITGTWTGTLHFEASLDSTNGTNGSWTNVNGRMTGVVNTILAGNATASGIYRGNTGAVAYIRVRATGGADRHAHSRDSRVECDGGDVPQRERAGRDEQHRAHHARAGAADRDGTAAATRP